MNHELDKEQILNNYEQETNISGDRELGNQTTSQRKADEEVRTATEGSQDGGRKEEDSVENDLFGEKPVDPKQKIAEEVASQVDAKIADIDKQIEAKQKEYEDKKKKFSKALSEDNQGSLFPVEEPSDKKDDGSLIKVARDVTQKNAEAILSPIQDEITAPERDKKALQDSKQKRIDDAIKADDAQLSIQYEDANKETNATPVETKDNVAYIEGNDGVMPIKRRSISKNEATSEEKPNITNNEINPELQKN